MIESNAQFLMKFFRYIIVNEAPFPGLVYIMPRLHTDCTLLFWEEMEKLDLKYFKVPQSVCSALKFAKPAVEGKIKEKFDRVVERRR